MNHIKNFLMRFRYGRDLQLYHNPERKNQDLFAFEVLTNGLITNVTGFTILTAMLISLGASDGMIAQAGMLPRYISVLSIFTGFLLVRVRDVKRFVVAGMALFRLCALLPVLFLPAPPRLAVWGVVAAFALSYVVYLPVNPIKSMWFLSKVPLSIRGEYLSIHSNFNILLGLVVTPLVGLLLDMMKADLHTAFALLFALGLAFSAADILLFSRVEQSRVHLERPAGMGEMLKAPLRNRKFIKLIVLVLTVDLALSIASVYGGVFALKYLQVPYTFYMLQSALGSLVSLWMTRAAGRLADRCGYLPVILGMLFFNLPVMLGWAMMTRATFWVLLPLVTVLGTVTASGYSRLLFPYRFSLVPEGKSYLYENFYSTVTGLFAFLPPLLAGLLKSVIEKNETLSGLFSFAQFRLLFLFSAAAFFGVFVLMRALFRKDLCEERQGKERVGEVLRQAIRGR